MSPPIPSDWIICQASPDAKWFLPEFAQTGTFATRTTGEMIEASLDARWLFPDSALTGTFATRDYGEDTL